MWLITLAKCQDVLTSGACNYNRNLTFLLLEERRDWAQELFLAF